MPTFGLYYRIVVTDKNGRIKKRTHWKKSKSWTIGFLQHLQFMMCHAYSTTVTNVSIKNTAGANQSFGQSGQVWQEELSALGPDNTATYGIVLGTGTTGVTNIDYKLDTIIAHGTGSGQLDYGASSVTAAQVVGVNVDLVMSRAFYNGSGATVTVKEMGIYVLTRDYVSNVAYILICRDITTSTDVLDTETVSAQYTFRTTA